MLSSVLIGLDKPEHVAVVADLGIRWAKHFDATLVGLAIVDEPGIRAIEPAWPVGGKPGTDPVYYMGYDAGWPCPNRGDEAPRPIRRPCDKAGVAHAEVKAVGSPHELIVEEAQSAT